MRIVLSSIGLILILTATPVYAEDAAPPPTPAPPPCCAVTWPVQAWQLIDQALASAEALSAAQATPLRIDLAKQLNAAQKPGG